MSNKAEQKITRYLHEAHMAESTLVYTLTAHIAMTPVGRYRSGLESHLNETRDHVERLEKHLAKRDAARGMMQASYDMAQGLVGQVLAIGKVPLELARGMSGQEKLLKNAKEQCANEAEEIATYIALEQLALAVDDQATARLAASIRKDEELMLARLLAELPKLATDLARAEILGEPQFDLGRTGIADVARALALGAARSVVRSAGLAAGTVAPPAPRRRPVARKAAAGRAGTHRTAARRTATKRPVAATKSARVRRG